MYPNMFTESNNNHATMLQQQEGERSPTVGTHKGAAEGMNIQAQATSLVQLVDQQDSPPTNQKQGKGHAEDDMFDLQVEELFHGNHGNQGAAASSQVTQQQQGAATSVRDPFQASANSSASLLMNFTQGAHQGGETALIQNQFQAPDATSPHMLGYLAGLANESPGNAALHQLLQYQIMQLQQQQLQQQQQLRLQQQLQGQSAQLPLAAQEQQQQQQQQENNESSGEDEKEEGQEDGPEKPKRSLSAYNIFFQTERKKLLKVLPVKGKKPRKSHGKIGFAEMARTVAAKWKSISPEEKAEFQHKAAMDKERYKNELIDYQRVRSDTMLAGAASGSNNSLGTMRGYSSQPSMNANPATIQRTNLAANIFLQGLSSGNNQQASLPAPPAPRFARDVSQGSMASAAGLQSGLGQRQSSLQSLASLRRPSNNQLGLQQSFPSGNNMQSIIPQAQQQAGGYGVGLQRFSSETSLSTGNNTYQSLSASSNNLPAQVSNPAFQAFVRANSNSQFSRVNSGSFSSALNNGTGASSSQNAIWGNPNVSLEQQRAEGEQINFFMNMLRGSSAGNRS